MPATAQQIEANRANAALSSGPVTAQGKAISSHNATRHGLTAAIPLILPDEQPAFDSLANGLASSIRPEGALEDLLFSRLVHAAWNLRRCDQIECEVHADGPNEAIPASVDRYAARAERAMFRCIKEIRQLQTERGIRDAAAKQQFPLPAETMDDIPPLAAFAEIAKRTQPPTPEQAVRSAFKVADRELVGLIGMSRAASAADSVPREISQVQFEPKPPASTTPPTTTYRRDAPKTGRNDACTCGSGQKY